MEQEDVPYFKLLVKWLAIVSVNINDGSDDDKECSFENHF